MIKLPILIPFADYHEIFTFEDKLRRIIPRIKVKEVGFARGDYQAIAYLKKDKAYHVLIKKLRNMPVW